jgi:predicted nucleic acid-binding protein
MILIDSNILLDLLNQGSDWHSWSAAAVEDAIDNIGAAIDPIIYAEASLRFATQDEFDEVFPSSVYSRLALPYSAAFIAAKAHLTYRRRGGARTSTLPDFLIGAHAAVAGHKILTRDPRRFRRYFPSVELICPSQSS